MCSTLYLAGVTPLYALLTFLSKILSGFAIPVNESTGLMIETSIIDLIVAGSILTLYLVERWRPRPMAVSLLSIMVIPQACLQVVGERPVVVYRRHVVHLRVRVRRPGHFAL
ncbi:hypothetical protein A8144_02360 [Mycobacterium leprae 3125609]|nr:hypothetical protein A8144_02360 [Mycobacterium leprae 3125609]OAX72055.1 hypothetical protein A3216_02430 [Mycobacterium leprae 7935681]